MQEIQQSYISVHERPLKKSRKVVVVNAVKKSGVVGSYLRIVLKTQDTRSSILVIIEAVW